MTGTIFAVSSGAGRAGVAVIRLSGPDARRAVETIAGSVPADRRASVRSIRDRNGETIDKGLVIWFPGPGSFTGEDMAEFQVHGGRAVVSGLLEALASLDCLRPAVAGEFARRAFENGKLDLTEVEGLADLIDAETVLQRRQAVRQLEGRAGRLVEDWRARLVGVIALCEAGIDFVDEDDVPESVGAEAGPLLDALASDMRGHLRDSVRGETIRSGLTVVIAGPPNAGKSSLMNALARRDVVIVSDIPGTTRDSVEIRLDLGGFPVTVVDTAGIRESGDAIEAEGVRRAEAHMKDADLVLWLSDASVDSAPEQPPSGPVWLIETKIDEVPDRAAGQVSEDWFVLSSVTGAGLDDLLESLETWVGEQVSGDSAPIFIRVRHERELLEAVSALERALELDYVEMPDLVAEELRSAATALGRITGRIDVEEVLDAIFRDFCIGK